MDILREKLILSGIEKVWLHKLRDFSLRKAAACCRLSCATLYEHFRDKNTFLLTAAQYIYTQWRTIQQRTLESCTRPRGNLHRLHPISSGNPAFPLLYLAQEPCRETHLRAISEISPCSAELIRQYCEEVHMPEDVRRHKIFVVRSLLYGAALMFDNGELLYTPENPENARRMIDREFDLP